MIAGRLRRLGRPTQAVAALAMMALVPTAGRPEGLGDAIALAYQTNPTLLAGRADLRSLDERYVQAGDALGPTASVSEQHTVDNAAVEQPGIPGLTSATTNHTVATTDTAQLVVNQPIYDGGQLSTAITAAKADVLGGRQRLRQQEAGILGQVIGAYADVLLAQQLVIIARQNIDILNQQLAETRAKVDVKADTLTDRAQAQARLTAGRINLSQAEDGLATAQAKYLAVVGQAPGQLDPLPDLPGLPPTLDDAFDAAERTNPELQAAVYAEVASRARVAEAKAASGLQVNFQVGLTEQPAAPFIEDENARGFTTSLTVSKPLFASGLYASRVREALETNNADELRVAAERRQVVAAVAVAWSGLAARRDQIASLRDQLSQEELAFQGSKIEERIGLRTTIDVLNAEQEFQSTKTALAQGYRDEYVDRVNLLAAAGLLQAELLAPDIEPYRPEQSLDRRTMLSNALPWERLVNLIDSLGAPRIAADPPPQDPLGEARPHIPVTMPAAPQWTDLTKYLNDDAGGS